MYSVYSTLLVVGMLMLMVGFIGSIGSKGGLASVGENVAASLALLVLFTIVVLSFGSFAELRPIFEALTGGVSGEFQLSLLADIADYGSLHNLLKQAPLKAAESFFDVILFSILVELLSLVSWSSGKFATDFICRVFTGSVIGLIALVILNTLIKQWSLYQWMISAIGVVITVISVGSIPLAIIRAIGQNELAALGLLGTIAAHCAVFRKAFLKSLVFLLGIWILEEQFGSLAAAANTISLLIVAFLPVVVMLIGLGIIVKSVVFGK